MQNVMLELLFNIKNVEFRGFLDFTREQMGVIRHAKKTLRRRTSAPVVRILCYNFHEHIHECSQHPKILARIPRKLKQKLIVTDNNGHHYGLGHAVGR